ncbi:MAG: divergent polysaccharide deacetylase family protein [bacterium]|jgi:polysaccharide deacetylase 2 family uncharacterized protein YibQ|nr:divergent polysaccharide deacetylase family protein [Bacillota bacterium]HHW55128.1 divergent polysaccharide deacetylase family protein [Bacillota bacterium]
MKRAVLSFLLLIIFVTALAGCGLFSGREPEEPVKEEGEEIVEVPVGEVDRALETALARGDRYIIVADETREQEVLVPGSPPTRLIWNRRVLRVSLPEELPMASYLAALEEELAAVGAEIRKKEEGGTDTALVVTLEVGIRPEVAGREVSLVTHGLTLLQGKAAPPEKGKLAIIIDDFGGGVAGTREMMELEIPLTFAVIPHRNSSQREAQEARERGYQVLLHMPMEPLNEKLPPGPGAITAGMAPEEIREAVAAALEEVPGAVGVNNHMGSKVTAREELMLPFLEAVGERGLFFIDSRTTNKSVAAALARQLAIPTAENRIFLDNERELESIKAQLRRAAELAREEGEVIAIGHVHPAMAQALQEFVPELEEQGVELVFASQLAR